MSKPIRVGLIGLSSTQTSWAGRWAESAHLPYLVKSPDYTIIALCNSSVASAQKAITRHNLDPSKVKAYGDPVSLANDADVDLVVCCVNVEKHYELVKPVLQAGKDVYCEWPLAANLAQMNELASLAKANNVRTVVGLQERLGAYVPAIRSLLGDGPGQIGSLLSSNMSMHMGHAFMGGILPHDIAYIADVESGGNLVTIPAIHSLDALIFALGEIETCSIVIKNTRPTVDLVDGTFTTIVEPKHQKTAHDHMFVNGTLEGDVPFSFTIRGGATFKDTPGLDWRIYGTKGEIRLTTNYGVLHGAGIEVKVQVFWEGTGEVKDVDLAVGSTDAGFGLDSPADDIARLYDAFAKRRTDQYLDFEGCLRWARFIQKAYDGEKQ
ncbi:hypothetical protein B0A52_05874 [Exophiala mesophila]|uniref:Gfo/Idh/MocA-like oxidoreductase N-terminal domain-containing protein n=1 Tax=Exophiala mesophila TaxID=212818 RepID=A0A438N3N9_EXOME|nr:hypothetical protein B0A52_05874 [Exophiala mesophila]